MVNTMLTKIKNWVQKVPKKIKSFVVGMMAMSMIMPAVLPGITMAASPAFNVHPKDKPTLQVAKRVEGDDIFSTTVNVEPGDQVAFKVYIHNTVEDTVANSTRVIAFIDDGYSTSHTGTATISASNAASVMGAATVTSSQPVALEYVENTTKKWWFTGDNSENVHWLSMPNTILTSGIDIGDVQGCFEYVQYVTYTFNVLAEPSNPANLTLEKTVSTTKSNFTEEISVERDDTVWFNLQVANTGDEAAQNVVVRDVLPEGLTYVNGSTEVQRDQLVDNNVGDGIVTAAGLSIDQILGNNTTVNVRFQASVDNDASDGVKTNTGYAKATGISEISDTARVNVSVEENPDLSIAKTVSLGEDSNNFGENVYTSEDDIVRFRVVVTNNGDVTLEDVRLVDELPSGLEFYQDIEPDNYDVDDLDGSGLQLGNLDPSEDATIYFHARVTTSDERSMTNTARTWADNFADPVEDTAVVHNETESDLTTLSIDKMVAEGENSRDWHESVDVEDNDIVRFRLIVTNEGDNDAQDVEIWDELPSGLNYISNSTYVDGDEWDDDYGIVTSSGVGVGDLDPDEEVEVIFNARVDENNDRTLNNEAFADATNASQVDDDADVVVDNGDDDEPYLSITKSVDDDTVRPGQDIRYTIRVENTGDGDATNVRITDDTPNRIRPYEDSLDIDSDGYVEADDLFDDGVVIDELRPGEEVVIRYDARVDSDATGGMRLTNEAVARDDEGDRAEDDATVVVEEDAAYLNITKTVNRSSVDAGDEVEYTIVVENTGDSDATDLYITDNLPMHLIDYIRGTLEVDGSYITDEDLFDDGVRASRLRPGDEITITYSALVDEEIDDDTTIENMAEVEADDGLQDRDFAHVYVAGGQILEPSVKLTKLVKNETTGEGTFSSSNNANPGNVLVYKITLTNNGDETLTGLRVTDVLPNHMDYLGGTVEVWMNSQELSGDWNALTENGITLPDMDPEDVATITFRAKTDTDIANNTTLVNTTSVTADQDIDTSATASTQFSTVTPVEPTKELPKTGGSDMAVGAFMFVGLSSMVWFVREKMLLGSMM